MDMKTLALILGALIYSVSGSEAEGYTKTAGAWILSLNRRQYSVTTAAECAKKCDAETSFTCRSFTYIEKDQECWTLEKNSKSETVLHRSGTALYEKQAYFLECVHGIGTDYRGTKSQTKTGKLCQKWASNFPQSPNYTPQNKPLADLESNFCRNPDADTGGPWCYTTDPKVRWEHCSVPTCSDNCFHCSGEDYRGKKATTEYGYTCQRWDSQQPHNHSFDFSVLSEKYLEENYCRNPDGEPRPWCYTTSPAKRWDFCDIPRCTSEPPTVVPEMNCFTEKGEAYRGTIAVTESGKTCQSWSSQRSHKHNRTPENYPCKGLEKNYCRNPDKERKPWCYTTDPNVRWEYCSVPACFEDCFHCRGEDYRGKKASTENSYTCQRWDSQQPHNHSFDSSVLSEKYLEENYCRNPDGEPRPWCYTTSPAKRWDFCDIPRCTSEPPTVVPEMTCITGEGGAYRGTIAVTESGKTCQSWSSQRPHKHNRTPDNYPCKGLENNYCRNPDNERKPWCYTTDPNVRWEHCSVLACSDNCFHCRGEDYRGKKATTENSYTCQRWDSQQPHNHDFDPNVVTDKYLEENYCRNPDGEPRPWCYTTNPAKRWDFCDIPRCTSEPPTIVPEMNCFTEKGEAYRGMIAVTVSGKTCQSWSSQRPHKHNRTPENYPCKGLENNYCRNPDNERKPWCYTMDSETRWEYCQVPACGDSASPEGEYCYWGDGSSYRGKTSETISGKKCQAWNSMTPHNHVNTPKNFPNADLRRNFCRNPDGERAPWCYTTNQGVRWEYCNVEKCSNIGP